MNPILIRFTELIIMSDFRQLTDEEKIEVKHCKQELSKRFFRIGNLLEQSYIAHCTNDKEWQFKICEGLEKEGL